MAFGYLAAGGRDAAVVGAVHGVHAFLGDHALGFALTDVGLALVIGDYDTDFGAAELFLGLVLTLVTAPAALPYLAGIDLILQSGFGEPEMFAALAFYCFLYVLSLLALMALRSVLGPRSAALLFQVYRIVSTWMPRVVAVLLLILGALMIADGVTYFFGYPLFPTDPAP